MEFTYEILSRIPEIIAYAVIIGLGLWAMGNVPLNTPTMSKPLELRGLATVQLMGRHWPRRDEDWNNNLKSIILMTLKAWEKKKSPLTSTP